MTEVVAPSIWYPEGYPGPAYDLATVVCWTTDTARPDLVVVYSCLSETSVVRFNKAAFLAAVAAYSIIAGDSMRSEALWTVGESTYNLEKITCWADTEDVLKLRVNFCASSKISLVVNKADFEAAMQAYQDVVHV